MITSRTAVVLWPKNPQLNFEMNTGHIYKIKGASKSSNLYLSEKPKSAKNGQKLTNIWIAFPVIWLLKNPQLNCELNTGHNYKVKGAFKSSNL